MRGLFFLLFIISFSVSAARLEKRGSGTYFVCGGIVGEVEVAHGNCSDCNDPASWCARYCRAQLNPAVGGFGSGCNSGGDCCNRSNFLGAVLRTGVKKATTSKSR